MARDAEGIRGTLRYAKECQQGTLREAEGCQGMPRYARGCRGTPGDAEVRQGMPWYAKGRQRTPKDTKRLLGTRLLGTLRDSMGVWDSKLVLCEV